MFILLVLAASLLIAILRGARVSDLANLRLRYAGLFFLPLLLQIIAFTPLGEALVLEAPLAHLIYVASLGLAAFALWLNRHLPGVKWIALGLGLNALVILMNGGFMPVSPAARAMAGMAPLTGRDNNVIPMTDATVLPWLGDVFPLPAFLPFANVFSIGDVLVALGGILFTQSIVPRQRGVKDVGE